MIKKALNSEEKLQLVLKDIDQAGLNFDLGTESHNTTNV